MGLYLASSVIGGALAGAIAGVGITHYFENSRQARQLGGVFLILATSGCSLIGMVTGPVLYAALKAYNNSTSLSSALGNAIGMLGAGLAGSITGIYLANKCLQDRDDKAIGAFAGMVLGGVTAMTGAALYR